MRNRRLKSLHGVPFLTNLNEDPILNQTLRYDLNEQKKILITRGNNAYNSPQTTATIVLNGVNIFIDHAFVENNQDGVFIKCSYLEPQEFTFVNGKSLHNLNTESSEEF